VEPVCAVLEFPASTYYAAKKRERKPSPRDIRDERLKKEIKRVWEDRKEGRKVYGARKVWLQLRREGIEVARCTVERLMRELGIAGVAARRKKPRLLEWQLLSLRRAPVTAQAGYTVGRWARVRRPIGIPSLDVAPGRSGHAGRWRPGL
jgi:transposase InsO family protein